MHQTKNLATVMVLWVRLPPLVPRIMDWSTRMSRPSEKKAHPFVSPPYNDPQCTLVAVPVLADNEAIALDVTDELLNNAGVAKSRYMHQI